MALAVPAAAGAVKNGVTGRAFDHGLDQAKDGPAALGGDPEISLDQGRRLAAFQFAFGNGDLGLPCRGRRQTVEEPAHVNLERAGRMHKGGWGISAFWRLRFWIS
jgi:hypothetical protein